MSATPHKIGRYEVREEIGRGAMGVVYRARDPIIGRDVAIKVLRVTAALPADEFEQFRHRFIREAQSAGILSHPNIVTVHDVVEESTEGFTFIAMEFVPGNNLRQAIQASGGLAVDRALEILLQVAAALDFAHSKGVVHRDIKPANILITEDHRVKITDFGIARMDASNLTQDGQLLGTPNYMAPEQILGNEVDHRADLFSLGVVLYETLTRQKPFPGENLTAVAHRVVYEPFTPLEQHLPELPKALSAILSKALEKDPAMRYQRGADMAADLRKVLDELRGEATSATLMLGDRTASGARRLSPPPPRETSEAQTIALPSGSAPGAKAPSAKAVSVRAAKPAKPPLPAPSPAAVERRNVRWVVGTFATLTVVLGLGLALLAFQSPPAPVSVVAVVPEAVVPVRSAEYGVAMAEGQRLLAAGEAAGAARAFAEAERLDPTDAAARQLRQEAERQASQVAPPVVQPAAPPPVRTARVPPPPAVPAPAPRAPVAALVAPEPEPVVDSGAPSELRIDFFTEVSPGVLTVYVGREQIYREAFRFQRRAGLGRTSIPGSLAGQRSVASGDTDLRVIVALEGRPTKVLTLQGNLPGGKSRTLQVRVDAAGASTAKLL